MTLLCSTTMPVPSNALAVPAELPMDIDTTMSREGWSTSTLAVVMTVATLVTTIKMVATCSSCFGKPGTGATAAPSGAGGGDEVLAFEVPGADVRLCSNVHPLLSILPAWPMLCPFPPRTNTRSIVPCRARVVADHELQSTSLIHMI